MPDLIIQFPRADYPSLQIVDHAYYAIMDTTETEVDGETTVTVNDVGGFNINNPDEDAVFMGPVKNIDHTTSLEDGTLTTSITVIIGASVTEPTTSDFVFFRKNPQTNLASVLGYYGSAKFINTSTSEAELLSVSCEITESSK